MVGINKRVKVTVLDLQGKFILCSKLVNVLLARLKQRL